jgi:transcriptional regulator of acetoin/glycerol metabolism
LSASWQRCLTRYGLDPGAEQPAQTLTSRELKDRREPLDRLIHCAAEELDRLHKIVGQARYVVLLCNRDGVAIDYRATPADASEFKRWGIYEGSIWSEDAEGTNGIGTSITEHRAVTVHRTQHFRARHISLSCSSAPILDADGTLVAVLDVSCFDPTLSEGAHALTGALVQASARAIEERVANEGATGWRTKPSYHRGGLPPGALKRVREHVEHHLADRPSIEQLATVAGLSAFHFARAFKQSQGMTPHNYLLHRRVQRAQELLSATECSLSEVAIASGFCDQSHFARHFRRQVGMAPSAFRRSRQ